MSKPHPVSVRLKPLLNDRLCERAIAMDRPKSRVIEQALADFMALQQWQIATPTPVVSSRTRTL